LKKLAALLLLIPVLAYAVATYNVYQKPTWSKFVLVDSVAVVWKLASDTTQTWVSCTTNYLGDFDVPDSVITAQYREYIDGSYRRTRNHIQQADTTIKAAYFDGTFTGSVTHADSADLADSTLAPDSTRIAAWGFGVGTLGDSVGWLELEVAVRESITTGRTDSADIAGWHYINSWPAVVETCDAHDDDTQPRSWADIADTCDAHDTDTQLSWADVVDTADAHDDTLSHATVQGIKVDAATLADSSSAVAGGDVTGAVASATLADSVTALPDTGRFDAVAIGITTPDVPFHLRAAGAAAQWRLERTTTGVREWSLRIDSDKAFKIQDVTAGSPTRLAIDTLGNIVGGGSITSSYGTDSTLHAIYADSADYATAAGGVADTSAYAWNAESLGAWHWSKYARVITAGSGLTGGGSGDSSVSLNVGAGWAVNVAADEIGVEPESLAGTGLSVSSQKLDVVYGTTASTACQGNDSRLHASGSDNQNVVAGSGLTGGGSGATVTLNVGPGTGVTVSADQVSVTEPLTANENAALAASDNPSGANPLITKSYADTVYSAAAAGVSMLFKGADTAEGAVELIAGTGQVITINEGTDQITFSQAGGGGSEWADSIRRNESTTYSGDIVAILSLDDTVTGQWVYQDTVKFNALVQGINFDELDGTATDGQIPDDITCSNYLPLSGGQMAGNITFTGAQTVDDIDVSAHVTTTTGIHGVGTGDIVGTNKVQTLTNKIIRGTTNTIDSLNAGAIDIGTLNNARLSSLVSLLGQSITGSEMEDGTVDSQRIGVGEVYTTHIHDATLLWTDVAPAFAESVVSKAESACYNTEGELTALLDDDYVDEGQADAITPTMLNQASWTGVQDTAKAYCYDTEAEVEAVVDLQDCQGAVTDGQVPNDITITYCDSAWSWVKTDSLVLLTGNILAIGTSGDTIKLHGTVICDAGSTFIDSLIVGQWIILPDNSINEPMLDADNSPTDEYALTWETDGGGKFSWAAMTGGLTAGNVSDSCDNVRSEIDDSAKAHCFDTEGELTALLDDNYEVQLNNEAGLYGVLSDVSDFVQPSEVPGLETDANHDNFSELAGTVGDAQIADGAVDGGTGGEIADQTITKHDIDSTSSDFVFNDAYRITAKEADSILVTKGWVNANDDDVPDAGDFGAATDLDANGVVNEANIDIGLLGGTVTDTIYDVAGWGSGRFDTVKTYNQAYWSAWTPPTSITVANIYATVESAPAVDSLKLQVLKGGVAIHTGVFAIAPSATVSNTPAITTPSGTWQDEYTCKIVHTDSTAAGLSVFIRTMQVTTINP